MQRTVKTVRRLPAPVALGLLVLAVILVFGSHRRSPESRSAAGRALIDVPVVLQLPTGEHLTPESPGILPAYPLPGTATVASTPPVATAPSEPTETLEPEPTEIVVSVTPLPPEAGEALNEPSVLATIQGWIADVAVEGNTVFWSSVDATGRWKVTTYDLATRQERHLSTSPASKLSLSVSGRYVVWEEGVDPPGSVLCVYDLVDGQELAVGSGDSLQRYPDISGSTVVWNTTRDSAPGTVGSIYGYDLQSGVEFPIVIGPDLHSFPQMSGDWVIYKHWPAGVDFLSHSPKSQSTLRARNVRSGEDIAVGTAWYDNTLLSTQLHQISGHQVIWQGSDYRTHLYDLASRQERLLKDVDLYTPPHLRGNLLIVNGEVYNVATGARLQLFRPDRPSYWEHLVTDGQTVAWSYNLSGEGSIYAARFRRLP